jgi:alpha-ketoglutarate-dependent taurine dioxygenase
MGPNSPSRWGQIKPSNSRDTEWYQKGLKISDTELAALPLTRHNWHGDWNYTLAPTPNV